MRAPRFICRGSILPTFSWRRRRKVGKVAPVEFLPPPVALLRGEITQGAQFPAQQLLLNQRELPEVLPGVLQAFAFRRRQFLPVAVAAVHLLLLFRRQVAEALPAFADVVAPVRIEFAVAVVLVPLPPLHLSGEAPPPLFNDLVRRAAVPMMITPVMPVTFNVVATPTMFGAAPVAISVMAAMMPFVTVPVIVTVVAIILAGLTIRARAAMG